MLSSLNIIALHVLLCVNVCILGSLPSSSQSVCQSVCLSVYLCCCQVQFSLLGLYNNDVHGHADSEKSMLSHMGFSYLLTQLALT